MQGFSWYCQNCEFVVYKSYIKTEVLNDNTSFVGSLIFFAFGWLYGWEMTGWDLILGAFF